MASDDVRPSSGARKPERLLRILLVVLVMVAAGLGAAAVTTRLSPVGSDLVRNDFTQDYVSARAWADGADPYGSTSALAATYIGADPRLVREELGIQPNPHPPTSIVLTRPFTAAGYEAARATWIVLTALLFATGVFLVARELRWSAGRSLVAGIATLALPVVQLDLTYVQWNAPIMLLVVLAWRWLRRSREIAAGIALGLATAIKLYPALLILPLLRTGRWRAAAAHAVSAAGFLGLGMLALGRDATSAFLRISSENFEFWRSAPMNGSLVAMPFRWLTRSFWRPDAPDVPALAAALALLVLLAGLLVAYRSPVRASQDPFLATLPWMVLLAPLSWPLTPVLTVPYLFALAQRSYAGRGMVHPVLLVAMAVVVAPIPGLPLPGPGNSVATVVLGYGLPTYALLVLVAREWMRGPPRPGVVSGRPARAAVS